MANIQRLGSAKPRTWDDGSTVSNVAAIGDGTIAESMAALGYGWNATSSAWAKLPIDNATGALKVLTVGSGSAVSIADGADVAQGTTTDPSSASTVVGILKAIKAAITGTLTTTTSWAAAQHIIVDTAPTTAVTLATNTPDVTDRAARLLGVVDKGKVWDGTNIAAVKAGVIAVVGDNPLVVTLHPSSAPTAAQPVTAASLPLPSGASTSASQSTVKAASTLSVATDTSQVVQQSPMRADASALWVTTISAANTTVTLTLPAAAAGLFHYITSIDIVNLNPTITAIAAAASTLSYTTTNLPGSPAWSCGTLLAAGAEKVVARFSATTPVKSSVAATATTIVAPAVGTGGLCRINVTYYTAP